MGRVKTKIVMVLLLLIIFTPTDSFAETRPFHYVALGDSLTVGFEPEQLFNQEAEVYGFVDRLYEQILQHDENATMKNYGVNGLTSSGLKNLIVAMDKEQIVKRNDIQRWLLDSRLNEFLAMLDDMKKDIETADLITITIGGNDFGSRTYFDIRNLDDDELKAFVEDRLAVYNKNMTTILDTIYKLNPTVTVVLTDQYNPFPRLNRDMYQKLTYVSAQFSSNLEKSVKVYQQQNYQIKLAPIAKNFVHREVLFTHILRGDIHPNQRGYERMAKTISETVWGGYNDPIKTQLAFEDMVSRR